jgi:hypothetical protein
MRCLYVLVVASGFEEEDSMPPHFDRFRLLNGTGKDLTGVRFRNESYKAVTLHGDIVVPVEPGAEAELPVSSTNEIIVEVENPE